MVYADSLNSVSDPGFRFTGDGKRPSIVESFERSISRVEKLPCDVLIAVHPGFADLDGKLAQRKAQPNTNPFIDGSACRAYAAGARQRLAERVAEEKKSASTSPSLRFARFGDAVHEGGRIVRMRLLPTDGS